LIRWEGRTRSYFLRRLTSIYNYNPTQETRASIPNKSIYPLAARRHSFGLLINTSNEEWETIQQKTIHTSWYGNPKNPLENVDNPDTWNANNMIPNFDCPNIEMVPKRKKGEIKFVCNPQRLSYDGKEGGCLIYSFGCAGDFRMTPRASCGPKDTEGV